MIHHHCHGRLLDRCCASLNDSVRLNWQKSTALTPGNTRLIPTIHLRVQSPPLCCCSVTRSTQAQQHSRIHLIWMTLIWSQHDRCKSRTLYPLKCTAEEQECCTCAFMHNSACPQYQHPSMRTQAGIWMIIQWTQKRNLMLCKSTQSNGTTKQGSSCKQRQWWDITPAGL